MEALDSVDDLWSFLSDIGEDDYDKATKAFPSLNRLFLDDTNHSFSVSLTFPKCLQGREKIIEMLLYFFI